MAVITKDMTIGEIIAIDKGCAPIFFNIGMHCLGCPSSSMESVEMAAEVHGVDVDDLLQKLNAYFADK